VLATSREALRVPGEVVWRVPSLTVPDLGDGVAAEVLLAYEAIRLHRLIHCSSRHARLAG
jgi:predicted ATPase